MSKQKQYLKEKQKKRQGSIPLEYHASISQAEADAIMAGQAEWDKYAGDADVTAIGPDDHVIGENRYTRWKKPVAVKGRALIGKGETGFYMGMAYISRAEAGEGPDYDSLDMFLEFYIERGQSVAPLNRRMEEIGAEWKELTNGDRKNFIW